MLTTLDHVVDRLVTDYDPDRIILFGSRASGLESEESDYDLLIVKPTEVRPVERRSAVNRLLQDRQIALDLHVYTPDEVWRLYAGGSPLIEEVVETGRVLYMRKNTKTWLAEAHEDLECASILEEHGKYRGSCFHSQQSVVKGLKALLLERGSRPPRTHDLLELLNAVKAAGWKLEISMDDVVFLNSIYRGRYPTDEGLLPHGEPLESDARSALRSARAMLAAIEALL